MKKIDLTKYGINGVTEIVHNPSYEMCFEEETKPGLEGYEKGQVSEFGAVNVNDWYLHLDVHLRINISLLMKILRTLFGGLVMNIKNDNHPASEATWKEIKKIAVNELSNKRLFVVDAFCGANKDTRMAVRFIVEVAWQAHFIKNMFIKPTEEELENFEPDFIVYNASKAKVENYKRIRFKF